MNELTERNQSIMDKNRKIRNSVYGLALGDALGYPTEFMLFNKAVEATRGKPLPSELLVTDDTQMSIALVQGVYQYLHGDNPEGKTPEIIPQPKRDTFFKRFLGSFAPEASHPENLDREPVEIPTSFGSIPYIAKAFIDWSVSPENGRAPGMACMASLRALQRVSAIRGPSMKIEDWLIGSVESSNSKGGGTVMRSPWIGFMDEFIDDENLRAFCIMQSKITHGHQTALEASYLTALITRKLYQDKIQLRDVVDFATETVNHYLEIDENVGWRDLSGVLNDVRESRSSKRYGSKSRFEEDPSAIVGLDGTAEVVLGTALLVIDTFPDDPMEILRRASLNSGDTDTIAAVTGGIVGAAFEEDIWGSAVDIIERNYIGRLDDCINVLGNPHLHGL